MNRHNVTFVVYDDSHCQDCKLDSHCHQSVTLEMYDENRWSVDLKSLRPLNRLFLLKDQLYKMVIGVREWNLALMTLNIGR